MRGFSFEKAPREIVSSKTGDIMSAETVESKSKAPAEQERELTEEEVFRNLVNEGLFETFYDALDEAGFDDDELDQFKDAITSLPSERISGVLSLPAELRPIRLARFHEMSVSGKVTPEGIVSKLDEEAQEFGYRLGYHVSPERIEPEQSPDGRTAWTVKGYDPDDRDGGMPMAYYALDYENIFRKRPDARYMYVIRAQTGEGTPHKVDTSNNWGRAPGLSVIQEFDIREIEEEVREEVVKSREAQAGSVREQ